MKKVNASKNTEHMIFVINDFKTLNINCCLILQNAHNHNKNVFSDKSNKTLRIPKSYRQNKKIIVPVVTARDSIKN